VARRVGGKKDVAAESWRSRNIDRDNIFDVFSIFNKFKINVTFGLPFYNSKISYFNSNNITKLINIAC